MKVKKLDAGERFDAYLISAYCFHSRIDDVSQSRERVINETIEDWGAFASDGTLAAHIINNHYDFNIDGNSVKAGGIGAVSTLPEYRGQGAVRDIFNALLPDAYSRGEIISALFPFSHTFYRKMGYETVTYQNNYELSPSVLSGYRFDGIVKRWSDGEPIEDFLRIYNSFASNYNLSSYRDANIMLEHMKVDNLYKDRKFSYIFAFEGENIAYLTFTDIYNDPAAIINVEECAWINRDGFNAILAFLGRYDADYGTIRLPLPCGIDLLRIIRSPLSYDIRKTCRHDYMVRVINAKKLLEAVRKPSFCDFVIRVTDDFIAENNSTMRVTSDTVIIENASAVPDITVSVQALAQLAVGCINLDESMLRPDVYITAKTDMLRNVFAEKKIYVGEHF